ncbi:AEC family transporter [Streptomyces sp. J2-1]|uniref:AEC family transporter n=1 Tax=Streptomyces corallincola TaxID=2851888 RepID=UPI001C38046E|nr:AEC family transporter [Streptomyces corallincola]MBV2353873.1 AEC family transporter [Streptomyces corallincola]
MAHEIAAALLPVFFVLILGYAAGRYKIVDNRDVSSINRLVMTFAIPTSLFLAITSTTRADIVSHGGYIAVVVISLFVVYAAVLLLELKVFKHDKGVASVQALTVSFPNYASIGLPLSAAVIGNEGAIAVAIGIALGSVTVSPITLALLEDYSHGADAPGSALSHFGSALLKSVRKPIFWAPMLAFVLVLAGVRLPELLGTTLKPMAAVGAGAALFLTGLILSAQKIVFGTGVAIGVVVKNALMPLFAWGLCVLFGLDRLATAEAVLLIALPSGFFGLVFGAPYGVLPKVSGSTLMLSTVAGVISLSVVIGLLPV